MKTVYSTLALLLVLAALSSSDGASNSKESGEKQPKGKSDKGGSAADVAKLKVVADFLAYFLRQRGSSQLVQYLLQYQYSSETHSFDTQGTYQAVLHYLSTLDQETICSLEDKIQYDSVLIASLPSSGNGKGGYCVNEAFKFQEYVNKLKESGLEMFSSQHDSSAIIQFIISRMKEVSNTKSLEIAFSSLIKQIQCTCG